MYHNSLPVPKPDHYLNPKPLLKHNLTLTLSLTLSLTLILTLTLTLPMKFST